MTRPAHLTILAVALLSTAPIAAQPRLIPPGRESSVATPAAPPSYPSLAALALAAPVVLDVTVRGSDRIKAEQAPGLAPGYARYYVTGDVAALIRGTTLPVRLSWLADLPLDARGRAAAPRKKSRWLLFARPLAGRPAEVQLTGRDAQLAWTPDADRIVRAVLTEAVGPDAPPVVTGVANAFFVPGALPGEGETQVFLRTADARPISLSIVREPSGERRWSVALSEVTAAAAPPPARDTLLWYRLACALPPELPADAAVDDEPANAARAREDYAWAIASLGGCAAG